MNDDTELAYTPLFDPGPVHIPAPLEKAEAGDQRRRPPYVYTPEVTLAVNVALATRRPLLVKGERRTPMPFYVYRDGFEDMPWVPSGWMGSIDSLTLNGDHTENPQAGVACIRMRYEGESGWARVAWQHPPNNWGDQAGGFDLTGATQLELWARGEYGGEKIDIGVGLLGDDKALPDSGQKAVEGIVLQRKWQRYRVPLRRVDLSSIKTGFVVTLNGRRGSSVTVYLDSIRFVS